MSERTGQSRSSAPRLTEPQRKVLLAAAADLDYHTMPIGLADGPRRTARKLADLGLGRYLFYGTGMFQANRAGRELAAKLLRDAHRPWEATQRDIVWVEPLTPHDIGARGRAEVLGGGGEVGHIVQGIPARKVRVSAVADEASIWVEVCRNGRAWEMAPELARALGGQLQLAADAAEQLDER